jgi:putative peptide zinc metalloprotease protein
MTPTSNPADLERRKSLRIRLRPDLDIEAQKYEGRTFFVVKDPVGLRYYRLKDNEHFLLQFLDGKHTLEDAQKAYEKEFRPERLKLEDLEGFAQQLLTAGLAMSDSPKAGKQLFDRRKKRRRQEWLQKFTNILYIKVPIFDPERILQHMLGYVGWIFSGMFFFASVVLMVAAILLVATHFETFRAKLPNYHEFFSFKSVVYLWISLAIVKVIHEFGHGLSCKRFGGEVHEMGFLLMCLSPALYCNVSDAWVLPNKWHRIIISAAGIYVELVIAAIATFIWWYTPTQPFINNLALSLMVVCSVSTVVFNANPLMRYDGYYVLADWLEIPNLREKANRFLTNLVMEKCLGIEVPPEEYMQLWRKILFVVFAIVSYIYRWVVTFSILYFFYSFLRPHKLEVIGNALTLAAIASMTVWPLYRLGRNIHRRGRLPDMKRARVIISTGVLLAAIAFACFVPIPISRIRGLGLVQANPEYSSQVVLRRTAILTDLKVLPGDRVTKGMTLATFRDLELEEKQAATRSEWENAKLQLEELYRQKTKTSDNKELSRIDEEIARMLGKRDAARTNLDTLRLILEQELTLVAPRDGIVGQGPHRDDIGKAFEGAREQAQTPPVFTVHTPGPSSMRVCLPLVTSDYNRLREDLQALEQERKKTRKERELFVNLRVHGLDASTWEGKIARLDESEARFIPQMLSNRAGGPVPVQAPTGKSQGLVPQTQHFLVYIDIVDADEAIEVGAMAQAKIALRHETCLQWAWRKVNDVFNLRLL